jgi:hypothetical protein
MSKPNGKCHRRAGITFLELEVAFVVFGIALSGLAPLIVMHMRHVAKLEKRFNDQSIYYLVPAADPWVRKLGAAATVTLVAPTSSDPTTGTPVNSVQILSVNKSFSGEDVSATVSLTAVPN